MRLYNRVKPLWNFKYIFEKYKNRNRNFKLCPPIVLIAIFFFANAISAITITQSEVSFGQVEFWT